MIVWPNQPSMPPSRWPRAAGSWLWAGQEGGCGGLLLAHWPVSTRLLMEQALGGHQQTPRRQSVDPAALSQASSWFGVTRNFEVVCAWLAQRNGRDQGCDVGDPIACGWRPSWWRRPAALPKGIPA